MIRKHLPIIATTGIGLLLWTASSFISKNIAGIPKFSLTPFQQDEAKNSAQGTVFALEASVDRLPANSPEQRSARVQLADALARDGLQTQDMKLLARSLEHYSRVLREDPNHSPALRGIAGLSFEAGVLNKAEGYYQRYLVLNPDDQKAQNDYALVLVQQNRPAEALPILSKIVEERADFFPPRLSLALAHKVSGNLEEAREQARIALELAPDVEARGVVENFIAKQIDGSESSEPAQPPQAVSPATAIANFFRSHEIIGPKISSIEWTDATHVRIVLGNFPIEHMPPFARQAFERNVQGLLKQLSEPVRIALVDQASNKVLMSFPVEQP